MTLKSWIYDRFVLGLTSNWYLKVLEHIPQNARILDVGIGTGGALAKNAELVIEKNLQIVGIDINAAYSACARKRFAKDCLNKQVTIQQVSIHEFEDNEPFDIIYFSGSFMVIQNPVQALCCARQVLAPNGRVYFTQTFHEKQSWFAEFFKPMLLFITTIDFGNVTYEQTFMNTLENANFVLEKNIILNLKRNSSQRMIIARQK